MPVRAATWASVRISPSWAPRAASALSRCFVVVRSCRGQTPRTPAGEIRTPRLASSLATRTGPQVGGSSASPTPACSTSGATRFWKVGRRRLTASSAASPPGSSSALNREKLSRLSPRSRQARLTLPSCLASSSSPTFVRMIFGAVVIASISSCPLGAQDTEVTRP